MDLQFFGAKGSSGSISPSSQARNWQGSPDYPGVDNWTDTVLSKGSDVWGGAPGQSNFYTTNRVMIIVGTDAKQLNAGLQIGLGNYSQFRPGMTLYYVQRDINVGFSKALANPQYGVGGFEQYFIPNYQSVLKPIFSIIMTNR